MANKKKIENREKLRAAEQTERTIRMVGIGVVVVIVLALIYRPLVIECVDPGFMRSVSRAGGPAHLAFLGLVVVNLVSGFHALGTLLAVGIMMLSADAISDFVHKHPTVKMLALSFLLLIGVSLLAEGFDQHISKGYIYFAMGFSVFVEMINLRMKKVTTPLHLKERYTEE